MPRFYLEERGPRHRQKHGIAKRGNTVLIGRDSPKRVCVQLLDETASRLHARLVPGEDDVVVTDMGSTHGTVIVLDPARFIHTGKPQAPDASPNCVRLAPRVPVALDVGQGLCFGHSKTLFILQVSPPLPRYPPASLQRARSLRNDPTH